MNSDGFRLLKKEKWENLRTETDIEKAETAKNF